MAASRDRKRVAAVVLIGCARHSTTQPPSPLRFVARVGLAEHPKRARVRPTLGAVAENIAKDCAGGSDQHAAALPFLTHLASATRRVARESGCHFQGHSPTSAASLPMSARALSRLSRLSRNARQTPKPEPGEFARAMGGNTGPLPVWASNNVGAPRHESSVARARKLEDEQVRAASTGLAGLKRENTEVPAEQTLEQNSATGSPLFSGTSPVTQSRDEGQIGSVPETNQIIERRQINSPSPLQPENLFQYNYPSSVVYVDTLEMVRKFERAGMDGRTAETVAREIANAARAATGPLASRAEFEKLQIAVTSKVESIEGEMKSRQREAESTSRHAVDTVTSELEKLRSELRFAHDKITTSQKLDLNLERGRLRDDLQRQDDKMNLTEIRLDREISSMKTTIEAAKNDVIKYSIGAIMSMAAVGMSLMRLMM